MDSQYTHQQPPELRVTMEQCPFTAQQREGMNDEVRALIEQDEDIRRHPVTAIWRQAVPGSITRNGGGVSTATFAGDVITRHRQPAEMAQAGDEVTYPDGTTVPIARRSGSRLSNNAKGYALAGRCLCNGDEMISTPQHDAVSCCHTGKTQVDDFLVTMER